MMEDIDLYFSFDNLRKESLLKQIIQQEFKGVKELEVTINPDGKGNIAFEEGSADELEVLRFIERLRQSQGVTDVPIMPDNQVKLNIEYIKSTEQ